MKTACVLLADGFEEIEALTPVDYLRRAGITVKTVAVRAKIVTGAHDIQVLADLENPAEAGDFDAVVVPGGLPGSSNIAASAAARALILRHFHAGKLVAAICAAPSVVLHSGCGILEGRNFTGYPGTETKVAGGVFAPGRVVMDGNIITARAAGCAAEFSLAIIAWLSGEKAARSVAESVLER